MIEKLIIEIYDILTKMAPFLILGFFIAGILSTIISPSTIEKHLSGKGILPIIKASILTDMLYSSSNGQEIRAGISTNWKWMNINAGTSISKNRNAKAMGFSLNYRRWKINYGIYFHETAVLGIPRFLDVRRYL